MKNILKILFFALFVRPLVLIFIGLNVRHPERLPRHGPAVLVANHNSHLDTLVLMSLFPLSQVGNIRPVAAADYFLKNAVTRFISQNLIDIIPLSRKITTVHEDPLAGIHEALEQGNIVILFPEGSRGEPEKLEKFKSGIAHVARKNTEIDFIPVFLHGLGKALPKGEALLVPFFCDVFIGEPCRWQGDKNGFVETVQTAIHALAEEGHFSPWQ